MADTRKSVAHDLRNLLGLIALELHAAGASAADAEATRRSIAELLGLVAKCTQVVATLESSPNRMGETGVTKAIGGEGSRDAETDPVDD